MRILALFLVCFGITVAQAQEFTFYSSVFANQKTFPIAYTCDGKDLSPPLSWKKAPVDTQSFVVMLSDADSPTGTFYHWVLYDIPGMTGEILEGGQLPGGTMVGQNGFGNVRYNGPCPPSGKAHNYTFTLYALDTKLNLPNGADTKTVLEAMKNHILEQAQFSSPYKRKF